MGKIVTHTFISIALTAMVFTLCSSAGAREPTEFFRVGYLSALDRARESSRAETIRLALYQLGYIEGHNIVFEYRYSEGKFSRATEQAADLVRLMVDIIVIAGGEPWVRAVKNVAKTIPIVMVGRGFDPVEAGLVKSLARPGGNITGLTNIGRRLAAKRLELLKEMVPKVVGVAVLYNPTLRNNVLQLKEVETAARPLKLTVRSWGVRGADDFERVFGELSKERPDGIYLPGGPLMVTNQKRIVDFALKSRLPSVSSNRGFVDAGGLMYYGADLGDTNRRVAYYVDRILRGAKPADLPVEQPRMFELVLNLKTAKGLGLKVPAQLLMEANKVIE